MTSPTHSTTTPAARRDGWTAQRRQGFLDALSTGSDVARACVRVGLSRQAAYNLRRRDTRFAAAWDEARRTARSEDERLFIALLVEKCPWARAVFPEACAPQGRSFLSQALFFVPGQCNNRSIRVNFAASPPALHRFAFGPRCTA